jgi:toxin secretion/phage lysis holin
MLILVCCNIIDYGTGLCAAKYRSEKVNSYKSIRGITKKVCMWLLVGVGAMIDWLLDFAAEQAGISVKLQFVVASVVAVWLIANEIISILENMTDIGVDLPPFLMKIACNIKSQAEKKADTMEDDNDGNTDS